jgi:hypothetical protein
MVLLEVEALQGYSVIHPVVQVVQILVVEVEVDHITTATIMVAQVALAW